MAPTSWTPGPWKVEREGDVVKLTAPPREPGWGRVEIADLSFGDTGAQRGANSALLALAPELADVLRRIAFEPFGHAEASDREVLDAITALARATLARLHEEASL
jgi:hypothetical protein